MVNVRQLISNFWQNQRHYRLLNFKHAASSEGKYFDLNNAIFLPRGGNVGVLLLHGYTSNHNEFLELADYLADRGITVLAPSIAGHGTTEDNLSQTNIIDWQRSVGQSFDFLKQQVDKVYIVGSSFGGNLALDYATGASPYIAGLVTVATPIFMRRHKFLKSCLYSYGWFKKAQRKKFREKYLMKEIHSKTFYGTMPIPSLFRFFRFIKDITIPTLAKVTAPTLVVQSRNDKVVDPISADYIFKNLGSKDKQLMLVDRPVHGLVLSAAHWEVFEAIYRFVSKK